MRGNRTYTPAARRLGIEGKGRLGGSPRCAKSSDCAAAGSGKVRSVRYLAQDSGVCG